MKKDWWYCSLMLPMQPFSPSRKEPLDLKSHSMILAFICPSWVQYKGDCEGDMNWSLSGTPVMFVQMNLVREVWESRTSLMRSQRTFWETAPQCTKRQRLWTLETIWDQVSAPPEEENVGWGTSPCSVSMPFLKIGKHSTLHFKGCCENWAS